MNLDEIPELAALIRDADHIDVKRVESTATLREFIAGMMAFEPVWMRALYSVRGIFVRLLGMRQERQRVSVRYVPDDVPMIAGKQVIFFTVCAAKEDHFWLVEIRDVHLNAWLAVIAEPLSERRTRYHVATIVKYNRWSGPLYFNVIRPFHHLVVGSMARAGARSAATATTS